jgi:acetyl-CoA/propionyl-CoA carboxylase biotin carboxyl carrier protein
MAMFESVLVANRGEIAVRVIRTLDRLGIRSVAIYTDPDRDALHVRTADEAVGIGPAEAYLDVDRVLEAARATGAAALHPGYGFLSENPVLARGCARLGIAFVGPPPEAIELMGDKINAKLTVEAAGVPVVPGRNQAGLTDEQLEAAALEIGLPVMFKPSAGGGGKGMRMVTDPADIGPAIAAARREALGAFGNATLLVERFVQNPRHIEVQVFADTHGGVVGLGERECSLQRRHQKIIEEAPSPLLEEATRAAMSASAVDAARSCGYVGAGTVEFIVPGNRADHYFFMEMNTRLQVEHPVTEEVLGLDLVEWQLRVAAGEALPWSGLESVPRPRGHAVEARIYAEDPQRGFLPSSGSVLGLRQPSHRPHIRVDSALQPGTVVGTEYDPMLAKVIAWGDDRPEALARLQAALSDTAIIGVTTNVGFLRRLVEHPDVAAGRIDTGLVERIAADLQAEPAPVPVLAAAGLLDGVLDEPGAGVMDPWDVHDGWRPTGRAPRRSSWSLAGRVVEVSVDGAAGTVTVGSGPPRPGRAVLSPRGRVLVDHAGTAALYDWSRQAERLWLARGGDTWALTLERETIDHTGPARATDGPVASPMPGTVLAVHVRAGDDVTPGQPLVSVEAMKMEHVVTAAAAGRIRQVLVQPGDSVKLDQALAFVDPVEEGEKP